MLFGLLAKIRCRNCKKKVFFLDFNAITLNLEIRENVHFTLLALLSQG